MSPRFQSHRCWYAESAEARRRKQTWLLPTAPGLEMAWLRWRRISQHLGLRTSAYRGVVEKGADYEEIAATSLCTPESNTPNDALSRE